MTMITQAQIEQAILTTSDTVIRNEMFFCDLDGLAGDGDFGNSLATGFKVIKKDVPEIGAPDIVLDDGSHIGRHQQASFECLFPLLAEGGLYVIEDLHSSYWGGFHEVGYRTSGSGIEQLKALVDDLHGHYHDRPANPLYRDQIASITFCDSIAIIEKRRRERLGHLQIDPAARTKIQQLSHSADSDSR